MKLAQFRKLPYPQSIWSAVLQKPVSPDDIPDDWEETLIYVFDINDSKPLNMSILYFFRDGFTLERIANNFGFCREYIRQVIEKTIRRARHPSRYWTMVYGLRRAQFMKDNHLGYWADNISQKPGDFIGLTSSIDDLNLSVRSWNGLHRRNISTVGELIACSEDDLMKIRNMGAH